jgi:hypothetical protein
MKAYQVVIWAVSGMGMVRGPGHLVPPGLLSGQLLGVD